MKIIKYSDFTAMPWKNGQGITYEAIKYPFDTDIDDTNFIYRISSAHIKCNSDFSEFKNRKRWLVTLSGGTIYLNQQPHLEKEIFHFSGDEKIFCEITSSHVIDLGIIYNPQLSAVKMQSLSRTDLIDHSNKQIIKYLFVLEDSGPFAKHSLIEIGNDIHPDFLSNGQNFIYIEIKLFESR